ncbi:GNAT family N-acetyltransferase [Frondihabitans australicus]|uniref:RimJ/RimL family protein N-acetyltransferase n=1 Tax=Frondihabitans australicus TaxID=386892 RepID=A0A495IDX3_9MICO|nr:GNAT family N-acetyltransferase [Frondihabitans australicus]RKR74204.1 RimJ/RimL family protein N-acetyltransferase [Frondihabitans australicus]
MEKVELTTERLTLRAPQPRDADEIAMACRDEGIQRWIPLPDPYTLDSARAFVAEHSDAGWAAGTACVWAIVTSTGFAGVIELNNLGGQSSIGYWLRPQDRGRGLIDEAARAVLDFALSPAPAGLGLDRIEWRAFAGNDASARVAARLGFRFEGTRRASAVIRGERRDEWVAAILRGDPRERVEWDVAGMWEDAADDRVKAAVGVESQTLTVAEITAVLGLEPDLSWNKGERRPTAPPDMPIEPASFTFTSWSIESRLPTTASDDEHLAHLWDRASAAMARVPLLDGDVKPCLLLVRKVDGRTGQGHGFGFESPWLELMGRIGGSIEVDQYLLRTGPDGDD